MPELLPTLRLFQDGMRASPDNMAMDEALMISTLEPMLRFYGWCHPTVSLGYFCSWADSRQTHGEGFEYVRRWTGGGTVEHSEAEITYSLVLPAGCAWGRWRAPVLYKRVHAGLAAALDACGIATDSFGAAKSDPGGACFEHPVAEDLVVAGKKIAGAAIRQSSRGVLLQGSIQGIVAPDEFPEVFAEKLAAKIGIKGWDPGSSLDGQVASLVRSRYGRMEWTQRR